MNKYMSIPALDEIASNLKWVKVDSYLQHGSWSDNMQALAEKMGFSLFNEILRSVAANCQSYLSDICYDIRNFTELSAQVDEAAKDPCIVSEENVVSWYEKNHVISFFGIRKHGIDGNWFVSSRLNNGYIDEYKDLFNISVRIVNDYDALFTLYRLER